MPMISVPDIVFRVPLAMRIQFHNRQAPGLAAHVQVSFLPTGYHQAVVIADDGSSFYPFKCFVLGYGMQVWLHEGQFTELGLLSEEEILTSEYACIRALASK